MRHRMGIGIVYFTNGGSFLLDNIEIDESSIFNAWAFDRADCGEDISVALNTISWGYYGIIRRGVSGGGDNNGVRVCGRVKKIG